MEDWGPHWYDRIVIEGGEGRRLPAWLTRAWVPCQDCHAAATLSWRPAWCPPNSVFSHGQWQLSVAHEDGCPTVARFDVW